MVCAGCGTSSASTETRCRSCGRRLPGRHRDVATGVLTPVPVPNETNVPSVPGDETLMGEFAGNAQTAEWIPAGRATPAGPSKPAVPPSSDDNAVTGVNPPVGADVTRQSTISTGDAATGVFTPVPAPSEPNVPGDETLMGEFAGNAQTAEWIPAGRANPGVPSKPAVPPPSDDDAVTGVIPPPGADVTRLPGIPSPDVALPDDDSGATVLVDSGATVFVSPDSDQTRFEPPATTSDERRVQRSGAPGKRSGATG